MLFKIILKKRLLYVLFLLMSYLVVHKALNERQNFDLTFSPSYDGVIYEHQQIQRYLKFEGDFSFKNRISQAIYEFNGNHVSGLYNSFIILFHPKLLITDDDILIRSTLALFVFCISFYLVFRLKYYSIWIVSMLFLLFQFPIFYNIRIGLGSYTPEFVSAIYLISGYLFLFYFFQVKKIRYFILGLTLFFIPISFRLNFFAYCGLLSVPFLILFLKYRVSFTRRQLLLMFGISTFYCLLFGYYIILHFADFYRYYTTICYAIGNLDQALQFMKGNFNEFFSWYFFLFVVLFLFGNKIFKLPVPKNIISNNLDRFIILYPFIIYFVFVVIILNSTNTPHIMSVLFLFCIMVFPIIEFSFFNFNYLISYIQLKRLILFLLIFFFSIFIFLHPIQVPSTYTITGKPQRFLINYLKQNKIHSMLNSFDAMVDIPINVAFFNENNKRPPFNLAFFTNDAYLKYTCKSFDNCLNGYLDNLDTIDLISINENENDPYINPMAKKIRMKLREQLVSMKTHKLVLKKYFPNYGNILFYRMR